MSTRQLSMRDFIIDDQHAQQGRLTAFIDLPTYHAMIVLKQHAAARTMWAAHPTQGRVARSEHAHAQSIFDYCTEILDANIVKTWKLSAYL